MASCGILVDWVELCRGESIEIVYIFVLKLYKDAVDLGMCICGLGYDNACTLLKVARAKEGACLPWTRTLVQELVFVLDRFHRDNHTWCLQHMPEVDPLTPANAKLLESRNTEACEQLNSWINVRTSSGLEMTRSRFHVYWWVLFDGHNTWLQRQADAKRRRYAAGGMRRDPDIPRHRHTD